MYLFEERDVPATSAISPHSIQGPHHPAAKGIGGRGQGRGSGSTTDFGEVLRGQAGVVSQLGRSGATAKQNSVPVSVQAAEKASGKGGGKSSGLTGGASEAPIASQVQIEEAARAKVAAQTESLSAQLQALSKGGAPSAHADNVQAATTGAAESKALEKVEKDDHSKLSPPGANTDDGKATKAKSGKAEKANKADEAGKSIAEKPPQVPVQTASFAAAPAPVSVPLLPAVQIKARVEYSAPPRAANAATPAAKPASGKPGQQAAKGTAEAAGESQAKANGPGLPIPDIGSRSQNIQPGADGVTEADLADLPHIKGVRKQDPAAIAAKPGSGFAPQAKHLNSSVPAGAHAAQAAQVALGGAGEAVAHIPASTQNLAGVSGSVSGASHGTAVGTVSPYDRIDQGTAPVVLHAGAQQVAVGVHDPSLGWVEIKTQSAAGHVDATLVASSGQTRDALAAQLPAISQFLEQRDVRVGSLVVNHQSAGSGTNHSGNGSGQHAGPGYGGNGGSGGNGANSGGERRAPQYSAPVPARHSVPVKVAGGESSSTARPLSYISVRA